MIAWLLHIHELAGYCHALFMFHEPLVAVPFSYEVSYESTLTLTPFVLHSFARSIAIESSLTLPPSRRIWLDKLFMHLLHCIHLTHTPVVCTFFSAIVALHHTCCMFK